MPTKPWYQSKTIWASLVSSLIGIYGTIAASGVHLPAIPSWVLTLLGAVGIYGRVSADTTITPS